MLAPAAAAPSFGPLAANPFLRGDGFGPPPRGAPASSAFQSARPDAPSAADAKRNADRAIRSGLAARDAAIGLGPEGPVLTALTEAARSSLAPERGTATFQATVDGAGLVVSLRLVGSTGGTDGWNDARDRAARALASTKLALRGSKGATITIVVESDVQLPSGTKPGAPPVRPTLKDSKVTLPEAVSNNAASDTVKTYTIGEGDLSDVGARPRRVVRARLVDISAF